MTYTTTDDAFPSNYLKAPDLKGRNVNLTIKGITQEEVGQDRENKPLVTFNKVKKGLILNVTNCRTIEQVFGKVFKDWIGKEIQLYPTTVSFQGSVVDCIRVRVPDTAPAPDAPLDDVLAGATGGNDDPNDSLGM